MFVLNIKFSYILKSICVFMLVVLAATFVSWHMRERRKMLSPVDVSVFEELDNSQNPENVQQEGERGENEEEKKGIKWVEFDIPQKALEKTMKYDIDSHNAVMEASEGGVTLNWIELLSYLSSKYWGHWKNYKEKDLTEVVERLKNGEKMESLITNEKLYYYYMETYAAILGGFVGEYMSGVEENGEVKWDKKYGLKAFSPIAAGFSFSHYDDFGVSRSYGYTRRHLGHDLMAGAGTPVIAIESGVVEEMGWNQYGGWYA